jgi:ABC-type glycerol-3-phosphate transport system permease component
LYEAGIIDGCSELRVFVSVMLPLAQPGIMAAAIFNFIGLWNEYFLALVFINSDRYKTLPLGLAAVSIQANYRSDFGLLFAALVIVMLPTLLVYAFLQRYLTEGITLGALKG